MDEALLTSASSAANDVTLARCTTEDRCLEEAPKIVVGGSGVSGGAFIDNAAFRAWAFETFGARVLDMESAAVAHVAYANGVPFLAVRSLADLAGGGEGANQMEVFLASRRAMRRRWSRRCSGRCRAGTDRADQVMNGMSTMRPRVRTASPIAAAAPVAVLEDAPGLGPQIPEYRRLDVEAHASGDERRHDEGDHVEVRGTAGPRRPACKATASAHRRQRTRRPTCPCTRRRSRGRRRDPRAPTVARPASRRESSRSGSR